MGCVAVNENDGAEERRQMSTSAERRAYCAAAILLAVALVDGKVEAGITIDDTDEIRATVEAFRGVIHALRLLSEDGIDAKLEPWR